MPASAPRPFAIEAHDVGRIFRRRTRGTGLRGALKSFVRAEYSDKAAVSQMNFTVPRGACVGLVGANGAGKTTLMKMCAGLLHPTAGSLKVFGHVPTERETSFQKKIGMVMGQKSQLWIDIPAMETFELLAAIYEIPDAVFRTRVAEMAKIFQVEAQLNVQVRRLSLGERMKLEIMAAILHNPELLILDEPTIGLDVLARRNIRKFILDYNRRNQTTILLSSHDMTDIQEVCSHLLLMADGRLVYDGALRDFEALHLQKPQHRSRDLFFNFDLGQDLTRTRIDEIAAKVSASVLSFDGGQLGIRVDNSQLSRAIQLYTEVATPSDIRIESQSLESIVHDLMAGK